MPEITNSNQAHADSIDDEKKLPGEVIEEDRGSQSGHESGSDGEFKQEGVRRAEAITASWTKKMLIITFVLIWLNAFVESLQQQVVSNLTAYVTSSFSEHSLLATTTVMSSIIGGVSKLTIAKICDIWGRVEGFCLTLFLLTIGLVMMAACDNVQTYAAAQVFYWVGQNGQTYLRDVLVADMTSLRNRAIISALISTPYIATTFAGPAIADAFYTNSTWQWAFGAFSIITPILSLPVVIPLWQANKKAIEMGVQQKRFSGRTWTQSVKHYVIEFDIMGQILIIAGFALILLPLSLASSSAESWETPHIIAMIVLGGVCLIAFGLWERFLAPVTFLPFKYLLDRTVIGACLLGGFLFVGFYCWDIYFSSYLQVVNRLSIRDAGYVLNIYSIGSCFWAPFVGLLVRYTNHFKWLTLCAIPVTALGTALLIHFRHPGVNIGYIVMCQIFTAFAGGTIVPTMQLAVMAAVDHQEVAVAIAIQGLFTSIGGSIGQSIGGSIWTNLMPTKLEKYLPEGKKNLVTKIYGSLVVAKSFPDGPVRDAIVRSYGETQRYLIIAGASIMPLSFACVLLWRNINVGTKKQTKGTVF